MSKELKTAIKIIKQVNKKLLNIFHQHQHVEIKFKDHREIVTASDIKINEDIIKQLLRRHPSYDIVSEEAKKIDNPGTETWYVDPIDGTTNFAYGLPEFSVCLGLEKKKKIA